MAGRIETPAQRQMALEMLQSDDLDDQQKDQILTQIATYDQRAGVFGDRPAAEPQQTGPRMPGQNMPQVAALLGQGALGKAEGVFNFLAQPFRTEREEEEARVRRAQRAAEAELAGERAGLSPGVARGIRQAGEMAPEIAAGGIAGLARTRVGRVIGEAAVGAASGAGQDQGLMPVLTGTAFGVGVGGAMELPGAGRDFMLRRLRQFDRNEARVAMDAANEFGIPLNLAEASEDFFQLRSTPFVSPNAPAKARFLANRQENAMDAWARATADLDPRTVSTSELVRTVGDEFDKSVTTLAQTARSRFQDSLRQAAEAVGGTVDDTGRIVDAEATIRLPNFLDARFAQLREGAELPFFGLSGRQVANESQDITRFIQEQDGTVTIGQLQALMARLTDEAYGGGDMVQQQLNASQRRLAREQLRALREDLAQATGPEARILEGAREQFAQDMAKVEALENSAVAQLSANVGDLNASNFTEKFMAMPAEEQINFLRFADRANPQYGQMVRGRIFQQLGEKHMKVSSRGTPGAERTVLDLNGLGKEFEDMTATQLATLTGARTPEARRMQQGIKTLRKIANAPDSATTASFSEQMQQYAINAGSRDPGFIMRLLAGEITPSLLDRLLYTPKGQQALMRIGEIGVKKGAFTGAAAALASEAIAADEELAQARAAANRERSLERIGQSGAF